MIQLIDVNKNFGARILFEDVNLTIGRNEKIGLIGRNGSGKSTFLKMLLEEDDGSRGEIKFANSVIIKTLEQNLDFEHETALKQVCASLLNNTESEKWKAESVLMGLGFSKEDFNKHPKQFSSGFQVRIRLAEALVGESDLLILDEPTNYLDIVSLRWLEKFLKTFKSGFLLVTHDRKFMNLVVDYTIGIHRAKMRKIAGGPQKLLDQIKIEEEVQEKTRLNQIKKKEKTEDFIRKFRSGARSAGLVQSRIKALDKQDIGEELEYIPEIKFRFKHEQFKGNIMLKIDDLTFGYSSDKILIQDLNLTALPGDKIAIVGRNGRGKSTLIKLIGDKLSPLTGKISRLNSIKIGYFGQDSREELNLDKSILEELVALPNIAEQEARNICGTLLFRGEDIKKRIKTLSGGEKSRVCLAKTLLKVNQLLILDEPTNHLDLESSQALISALENYHGTVIFVTHDEDMVHRLANRLIIFDNDTCFTFDKKYQEFLDLKGWSEERNTSLQHTGNNPPSQAKISQNELREQRKKLNNIEKQIAKLEKQEIENGHKLQDACLDKNHLKIKEYGEKAKQLHDEIHGLYLEFEQLMEQ